MQLAVLRVQRVMHAWQELQATSCIHVLGEDIVLEAWEQLRCVLLVTTMINSSERVLVTANCVLRATSALLAK